MFFGLNLPLLLPGLILLVACIDDLRSRKIHNKLILFLLPLVLLAVALTGGLTALKAGLLSALVACVIGIPLTLARAFGGGDLKLLFLLALTLNWMDFLTIFIYSLFWALILGLAKIILDKKLKDFLMNIFFMFRLRTAKGLQFHTLPFSIALFTAWLSFVSLKGLRFFS